jgi:16S rRNA processing protein RimM
MKEIGKIVSVHGVNGEVVIAHRILEVKKANAPKAFLVEIWNQSYIPFFVEELRITGEQEWICKFEEVRSREEAKDLLHKKIYLHGEKDTEIIDSNKWSYLIDYQLFDDDKILIGIIKDILENGAQNLIEVDYQGKLVHLPIHEDLVININKINKIIELTIPVGLLDL